MDPLVAKMEQCLARRLGEDRFRTWFAPHNARFTLADQEVIVGVPNRHHQEWLAGKFLDDVRAAACETFGPGVAVRFVIDPELFQLARKREGHTASLRTPVPAGSAPAESAPAGPSSSAGQLASKFRAPVRRERRYRRLEDFVEGVCNRVALASARSLVEAPDEHPCPLVLHGPVGTGKTHLLDGIYAGLREAKPDWRLCYVTAEEFTNRFLQAMHQGKLAVFRKTFRACDGLFLDDVQFLAGKQATQVEFLHTLDTLQADGRPVALACDGHPRLADNLLPELVDRLGGGAVWGLLPPDETMRLQFLRARALAHGGIPDDVLAYLAKNLHGNIRELEGTLHSLVHLARVTGRPIDVELAQDTLAEVVRNSVRLLRVVDVERAVCAALGVPGDLLRSKKRTWEVNQPRMLAMYLARKHTKATHSEIGRHLGGRNHATVISAEQKVAKWVAEDARFPGGKRTASVRELIERAERLLNQ